MPTASPSPWPGVDAGNRAILRWLLIAALVLGLAAGAGAVFFRTLPESCEAPFIRAIQQSSLALRHDRSDVAAHLKRAEAYLELGKHGKAAADYSRAITLEPQASPVYLARAKCFNVIGRNPAALQDLQRAEELAAPDPRSCHLRADILCDLGSNDAARAAYAEGLQLAPSNASLLTCQARMFRENGDLDAAERGFNAAIALDPEYIYAYHCRGQLCAARGAHAQAIADFTAVLEAPPTCFLRRLQASAYLARRRSAQVLGLKRYRFDLVKAVYEIARQGLIDRKIQAAELATREVPRTVAAPE